MSSLQSLSAPSQRDAESKLGRRILPLGFPSGTGYRGRGDNHRQRSILARRLIDVGTKSGQKETPIFRSGFRGGGKEVLAKMDDYFSFVLLNSFCLHSEVIVIKWT